MSPERIYDALATGVMKPQGDKLSDQDKRGVAEFMSGRPLGSARAGDAKNMSNQCRNNPPLSDAALQKAVKGPEPSWEVYARLIDRYVAQNDYAHAQALMGEAVTRFDNSPVLLPKRIAILHGMGNDSEAEALLPQCRGYDIRDCDEPGDCEEIGHNFCKIRQC